MADFRIDRIRFRWKNVWATGTNYVKDDIVIYQGKAFVALIGHTSDASFYTDLNATSPKWVKMLDGYEWKNNWAPNTYYDVGNIVQWKAYVYRALTPHTSAATTTLGLTYDDSKWELVAKGSNWLHNWTVSTDYDLGDVVRYNGYVYMASTKHTSSATEALGLEANQGAWTQLTKSDHWSGDWTNNVRYKVSDVVKYGGIVYRANTGHTSSTHLSSDYGYWDIVNSGIEYKGAWSTNTRYKLNDVIKYGPSLWKAKVEHTSSSTVFIVDETGDPSTTKWDLWLPGLEYETVWNYQAQYSKGDIVLYGGYAYTALKNNVGSVPSINGKIQDTGNWELLKEGYRHLGDWGEDSSNYEYKTGDVVRLNGFLYICLTDSTGEVPDGSIKWQVLVTGRHHRGEWADNTQYEKMDVVLFEGSAYLCSKRHISSASGARPDLDVDYTQEEFWTLLIQGEATNVLRERGDLRTHNSQTDSSMADERLAIGSAGQVLKANNPIDATLDTGEISEWGSFGEIPKVFYVSTANGEDKPTNGRTEGAPWKTIKYACDYIQADLGNRAPASVFIKTGVYEEILPISVPADVALIGDELRSTSVFPKAGYETSDMFRVRNGGGIRNMSLNGLTGTLGAPNSYGTRRPTAGAYVSLDPGTGPADTSVHITSKSPYIQNVSTFGTGCTGLRVDGSLHNAGNRSIVANDFTQILPDGIGYWCSYNGRSELVSVFTYYNHIGYLTEFGGRVRATNGNNSYGDFGSVAEGVNPEETAKTGTVNNRSKHAQVRVVETNGTSALAFGYSNAGENYTGTPGINLSGSGYGVVAGFEELRKNAVNSIRVIDPGDSSTPGGLNYTYIVNNAQEGDTTSIKLSNADTTGTSAAYVGQRIVILSGAGDGQYARISSYNSGTKVATVERESDGSAGWEHIYPGYPIAGTLTSATRYAIEPRVDIPEPAFNSSSLTVPHKIDSITANDTNFVIAKTDLISFSANAGGAWSTATGDTTGNWTKVKAARGTNYMLALQGGTETTIASVSGSSGQTWSYTTLANGANWIDVAFKDNQWIAISSGSATETTISTNQGGSWSAGTTISGQNKLIEYGNGIFVILPESGNTALTSTDGTTWTTRTLPVTSNWQDMKYANGRFVAVGNSDSKIIFSLDGITWEEAFINITNLQDSTTGLWNNLAYTQGVWLCSNSADNTIITSQSGNVWSSILDDSTTKAFATTGGYAVVAGGLTADGMPAFIGSKGTTDACSVNYGAKPFIRADISGSRVSGFTIYDPGSGYSTAPTITIYDYANTIDAVYTVRVAANGVLGQPVFTARGLDWNVASATITGSGFAEEFQTGQQIVLTGVTQVPGPGENFIINGIDDIIYKVVSIDAQSGAGPYDLTIKVDPAIGNAESPTHGTSIELRENYSQIRLTGHDFLDIGTGNFSETNYPILYTDGYDFNAGFEPKQFNEVVEQGGGRVFYTSTDQDGNFRAGEQFLVEQATGIITLNSSLFNFSGLQSLTLGGVVIGGTAVVINEFSKEQTFIANSNNIVPTQRAIAAYVASRVSGGGSNASTNTLNVGQITVSNNNINQTASTTIQVPQKMIIKGGADGHYLSSMYFSA
tara:strand:+ start:2893 stop:7671 length:4779 start_codon:yes stop_codon:yes gene_type:complete